MDLTALKSEIDTDPLGRGYSGMTDVQVVADLSAVYRDGPVPAVEAMQAILSNSLWATLRQRAELQAVGTYSNPAMRAFVDAILNIGATNEALDLGDGAFWADLAQACVDEGSLGAGARTVFLNLRQSRQSRAGELGAGSVTVKKLKAHGVL